MKITGIDLWNLRYEYPNQFGFRYAGGVCTARLTTIIRVRTDTEHVGIGSCYTHPALAKLVIKDQFEPLLLGRDPRETDRLYDEMYGLTRWYGRKGAALSALGALDMAFWDLRGKSENLPLWKMLGGSEGVSPVYGSALLWKDDVSELADEARALVAKGFRRMKLRMGRSEEYDTAAVRAVRAAIGPDCDIMVDASMRYDVSLARRIAKTLEECNVFWYEEPFLPEDVESYSALRGSVNVRIAAGENEFGVQGFDELIDGGCVDIVQPDASRCGGLTPTIAVAKKARERGLDFAPHTWNDAVTIVANAHVVAAFGGLTVEMDKTGNDNIETVLQTPLQVQDGMLNLGDKPGLGIELNESALETLQMQNPIIVPDGNYSDMVFGPQHWTPAGEYILNS